MTIEQHVEDRVKAHDETLYGKDGQMGIAHKVTVMWRAHVWVLCALSCGLGFLVRPYIESIFK